MLKWRDVQLARAPLGWDRAARRPRGLLEAAGGPGPRVGEPACAEALSPVGDGEAPIEARVDVDPRASVAAPAGAGCELEEMPIDLDGVVVLDRALILEAADPFQVGRGGAPGGFGLRGRPGEAGIVAGEEAIEDALGVGERTGLGEAEFADEAILKGAEEPFDPALALRRGGGDPANPEFLQRAADLGGLGGPEELLGERQRGPGFRAKDAMAIGVGGGGDAIAADHVAKEQKIAMGILLRSKDTAEDAAGGIVDGRMQDKARAAVLEPRVVTAVHLDEEAGLRHGRPAPAMPWGAPASGARQPMRAEEALHRGPGDVHALAFRQELGEVAVVAALIGGTGQGQDPGPQRRREVPRGHAAAVPMGQGGDATLAQCRQQAPDVADGQAQQGGGGSGIKAAMLDLGEDLSPLLLSLRQGDRLPVHPPRVTESLSSYGVTESLSSYSAMPCA